MGSYLETKRLEVDNHLQRINISFLSVVESGAYLYVRLVQKHNAVCKRVYDLKESSGKGDEYKPSYYHMNKINTSLYNMTCIGESLFRLGSLACYIVEKDFKGNWPNDRSGNIKPIIANMGNWLGVNYPTIKNLVPEPFVFSHYCDIDLDTYYIERFSTFDLSKRMKTMLADCKEFNEVVRSLDIGVVCDDIKNALYKAIFEMDCIYDKYKNLFKWISLEEQYKVSINQNKELQNRSRPFLELECDIRVDGKRKRCVNGPIMGVRL